MSRIGNAYEARFRALLLRLRARKLESGVALLMDKAKRNNESTRLPEALTDRYEHLRNQVEGAIVMGLGGALFEEIQFGEGKIATNRLARYRVPRFADTPVIESVLLDRKDLASAGAGETPIVGIAPAIGNAIFDANGKRIRRLPLMA